MDNNGSNANGGKTKSNDNSGSSNTFEIIIIIILIVMLVILATIALWYAQRRAFCYTYPAVQCYKDWMCPDLPSGSKQSPNSWDNLLNAGLTEPNDATKGACYLGASDDGDPKQQNCPTDTTTWPFLKMKGLPGGAPPITTPPSS